MPKEHRALAHATETDVIIRGTGAAGLTPAIDLARRNLSLLLIDKAAHPFVGSCGKGIQLRFVGSCGKGIQLRSQECSRTARAGPSQPSGRPKPTNARARVQECLRQEREAEQAARKASGRLGRRRT
ncbi:hypothetical protein ACFWPQ_20335 [Streptomyces sp. NPDC058464]|uniref:hypothetical protein n=1 Tax=Streptomyces sp. NPDC058464 TaxID=3346511 RepID=UPI00365591FC